MRFHIALVLCLQLTVLEQVIRRAKERGELLVLRAISGPAGGDAARPAELRIARPLFQVPWCSESSSRSSPRRAQSTTTRGERRMEHGEEEGDCLEDSRP